GEGTPCAQGSRHRIADWKEQPAKDQARGAAEQHEIIRLERRPDEAAKQSPARGVLARGIRISFHQAAPLNPKTRATSTRLRHARASVDCGFGLFSPPADGTVQEKIGMAQRESSEARLTLGTATPGGGFPLYGAALIEAVREVNPSLTIEPRSTKGSTENVPLLRAGALDIALVQGEVAGEVLSDPAGTQGPLWIIAAMYSTPGLFVTRGDRPDRAIADLRGRSVAFGARGSGL